MSKDSLRQWDTAAANNTDIGGTDISGTTGKVKDGDNAIRSIMAQLAQSSDEMGYPTAGGSADALTLAPATASAAYASNDVWTFKAASSNTTAATLNISGLGAKAIRKMFGGADIALVAGDIAAGARYKVVYDSAANAAAGAWIIASGTASLTSTTEVLTGTDAIKSVTSDALAALWEKGSDVASAGTVTLGEGGLFHITGTTTITDIDFATPKDGRRATLIFDGILTLTHNATTLRIEGGANITTAAGDRCDIVQDSGDNIYVINYTKADGTPVVSSVGPTGWTPGLTFGGSAAGITGTFNGFYIKVGRYVAVNAVIILTNNGSGSGAAVLTGLPFTADSNYYGTMTMTQWSGMSGIVGAPVVQITPGAKTGQFYMGGATASPAMTDTNITNTALMVLTGFYITS